MLDSVLQEILTELQKMNAKLGDIREELTDIKPGAGRRRAERCRGKAGRAERLWDVQLDQ